MENCNRTMQDSHLPRSITNEVPLEENQTGDPEFGKERFVEFSAAALETLLGYLKGQVLCIFQSERHAEPLHLFDDMVTTR